MNLRLSLSLLPIAFASLALATGEYHSSGGYTIKYPAGWERFNAQQVASATPAKLAAWGASPAEDLVIVDPSHPDITIKVRIAAGLLPHSDGTLRTYAGYLRKMLTSIGCTPEKVTCQWVHLGRNEMMESKCLGSDASNPSSKIHMDQYFILGHGVTYILTCRATSGPSMDATFDKIVSTFKVG